MDEGRWITTKYGARVFIKNTNDFMNSKIRNEYKLKKDKNTKNRIITSQEKRQYMEDMQNKYNQYEKERDELLEKLKKDYTEGKVGNDEYDEKFLKIHDDFSDKTRDLHTLTIYDEKNDNYMVIEKSTKFYEKKKDYLLSNKTIDDSIYSDEEKESVYQYTTSYGPGSSSTVNRFLYGQNVYGDSDKIQENISNIDSAMNKSKIGGEYQLYRSVEPSMVGNGEYEKVIKKINTAYKKGGGKNLDKLKSELEELKGKTIENKGYVSTSTFLDKNYSQRGVTYIIDTKPDDRAIDTRRISAYNGGRNNFMSVFSKGNVQTESEVLYDRNTNFKIKDVVITDEGVFLLCDTEQKKKK